MPDQDPAKDPACPRLRQRLRHAARLASGLCTREGAWERWLTYFLRGVQIEAEDAIARMEQIDRLFEAWREELAGAHSGRPREVLRLFAENPFWSATGIAEELGVAYTTGLRAVERLQAAGIVSPVGSAKRNRVYCARDMLEVLEAPRAAGRSVPNEPSPHKHYGNER